ncbi:MAG: hypothetical protein JWR69_1722 [Pedosphaera sp.]|nr:hypothetical protein [Pedosphaera sp.]
MGIAFAESSMTIQIEAKDAVCLMARVGPVTGIDLPADPEINAGGRCPSRALA